MHYGTILVLFLFAAIIKNNNLNTIETAAGAGKLLPIYSVDTNEKKVALTINCAWEDSDIDNILGTLNKHKIKVTFFVVGDWAEKYPESLKKIKEAGMEIRKPFVFTSTCKQFNL